MLHANKVFKISTTWKEDIYFTLNNLWKSKWIFSTEKETFQIWRLNVIMNSLKLKY